MLPRVGRIGLDGVPPLPEEIAGEAIAGDEVVTGRSVKRLGLFEALLAFPAAGIGQPQRQRLELKNAGALGGGNGVILEEVGGEGLDVAGEGADDFEIALLPLGERLTDLLKGVECFDEPRFGELRMLRGEADPGGGDRQQRQGDGDGGGDHPVATGLPATPGDRAVAERRDLVVAKPVPQVGGELLGGLVALVGGDL